jgi:hypothetical protein
MSKVLELKQAVEKLEVDIAELNAAEEELSAWRNMTCTAGTVALDRMLFTKSMVRTCVTVFGMQNEKLNRKRNWFLHLPTQSRKTGERRV